MLIEYDGTDFQGWQVQAGGATVQQALEDALARVVHSRVTVTGSGRTDSGVHARGQVAHFSLERARECGRLMAAINGLVPRGIVVKALERAPDGFHARYDARLRCYYYQVSTLPLGLDRRSRALLVPPPDFDLMNRAAESLLGTHNFSSFCRTQSATVNRVCTVSRAVWVREELPGYWRFEVEADRFLHGMVRSIVGTLVQIGQGKRQEDEIPGILAKQDRRCAGPAAPALGLVLQKVRYDDIFFE